MGEGAGSGSMPTWRKRGGVQARAVAWSGGGCSRPAAVGMGRYWRHGARIMRRGAVRYGEMVCGLAQKKESGPGPNRNLNFEFQSELELI
jgi:hypothetical protein